MLQTDQYHREWIISRVLSVGLRQWYEGTATAGG